LPALKDAALGNYGAGFWSAQLNVPRSQEFVAAFRKKYGYLPANYGASTFDAIFLIDSAVKAVHGNLSDKKALIAALTKAEFPTVRESFAFNTNHFPIENFYLFKVAKSGDDYVLNVNKTIFHAFKDSHASECKMPAE
jgi:branched-chain amino acid transport system substrate-binding protein